MHVGELALLDRKLRGVRHFCLEGSLSISYLASMALAAFVKHMAAPGGLRFHLAGDDFYQLRLRIQEGDRARITSEMWELERSIEKMGLRGQKALQAVLRSEVQMWHSLAVCSREMLNAMRPFLKRRGYPSACCWLGDISNLVTFVNRAARQTEFDRLVDWYGEAFDERLLKWIPEDVLDTAYKNMIEELGDDLMTEPENEDADASDASDL